MKKKSIVTRYISAEARDNRTHVNVAINKTEDKVSVWHWVSQGDDVTSKASGTPETLCHITIYSTWRKITTKFIIFKVMKLDTHTKTNLRYVLWVLIPVKSFCCIVY